MTTPAGSPGQLIADTELFGGLDDHLLDLLSSRFEPLDLAPAAVLFRQGQRGEAMYLLGSGELVVQMGDDDTAPTVVDRLLPGAVVGEMALLTSPTRNATVVAGPEGARLWSLSRDAFERLAAAEPLVLEMAHRAARPRLERAQLAPLFREWFGVKDEEALHALQAAVRWITLEQGESLFRRGAAGRGIFLVVNGRLAVSSEGPDGIDRTESIVGRGGTIGEQAMFAEPSRALSATAVRNSHVIEIPPELVEASPIFIRRLAAAAIHRAYHPGRQAADAISIALVPATPGAPVAEVATALATRFAAWGEVARLSSALVDERFGRDGVAQSGHGLEVDLPLSSWLDQQERSHAYVLFETDTADTAWTSRALRHVDAVVLVADADAGPEVGDLEAAVLRQQQALPTHLVLVHPDERERPRGTMRWLEPRPSLGDHHHLRLARPGDLDRLARRLAGRATGLALSGGGARGYVHVGLLRATEEQGLPIDMIVGTSMGAVVGACFALTQRFETCRELARGFGDRKKVLDYTLPLVALTRSKKVTSLLKAMVGEETCIEDLWIPFACVSASLTRSEPRILRTGQLWRAVRASAAIPGVFTPVLMDGEVMVDGGVMNNFPVDVVRQWLGPGTVIASNAYGSEQHASGMTFGDDVSGWQVARQKILPFLGRRTRAPSMLGTLMRATSLGSRFLMEQMGTYADLVVRYPTEGISSLEFDDPDRLIDMGHEHGSAALNSWVNGRA